MPENTMKAEVSLNDGVATATVSLSETHHHTETVPLHPRYPQGAPDEFLALDSLRSAIATVEKESFPTLFDLIQTMEEAERADRLGLCRDEPRRAPVFRRSDGQTAPIRIPRVTIDHVTEYLRGEWPRPQRGTEPPPYVVRQNGRLVVTHDGAFRITPYSVERHIDLSRSPTFPTDEWIVNELARGLAHELRGSLEISRRESPDGVLTVRADILVLKRELAP